MSIQAMAVIAYKQVADSEDIYLKQNRMIGRQIELVLSSSIFLETEKRLSSAHSFPRSLQQPEIQNMDWTCPQRKGCGLKDAKL